jgi:uncharacterized protein
MQLRQSSLRDCKRPVLCLVAIMRAIFAHLFLALLALTLNAAAEPALWRAEKNGSEIILFATLHAAGPTTGPTIGPAADTGGGAGSTTDWRTPSVVAAFARAGTIVLETQVIGAEAELAAVLRERGIARAAPPLRQRLNAADRMRFETLATERGLSLDGLDRVEPWLAALMIGQTLERDVGRDTLVDRVIETDARTYGKWLVYLETPGAQATRLADLSPTDQMQFLLSVIAQDRRERIDQTALRRAWQTGDEATLDALLNGRFKRENPRVHAALIDAPTQDWASTLDRISSSDSSVFVAVGAAHMVGEDGLLMALRARGFKVSRLSSSGPTPGPTPGLTPGPTLGPSPFRDENPAPQRVTRAGL